MRISRSVLQVVLLCAAEGKDMESALRLGRIRFHSKMASFSPRGLCLWDANESDMLIGVELFSSFPLTPPPSSCPCQPSLQPWTSKTFLHLLSSRICIKQTPVLERNEPPRQQIKSQQFTV